MKVWLVMHGDYNGTGIESVHISEESAMVGIRKAHKGYRPLMGGTEHDFMPVRYSDQGDGVWQCGYIYRNVRECGFSLERHNVLDYGRVAER